MANLFKWGTRRDAVPVVVQPELPAHSTSSSIVLPKFLSTLSQRPTPVILDLGPVVGQNVSFFGDRLACKLLIGDVQRDIDASKTQAPAELRERLLSRLAATVTTPLDGILCWDVFDFLDRPTSQAIGSFLTRALTAGGVVHGFFGTTPIEISHHTKFVVRTPTSIECRHEPASRVKRVVLQTRDIAVMFAGLSVAESVLLKSQRRETLLRKA